MRERLTAEGVGANNLLVLMAYEAGRNMAAISWNTSVYAVPLENQAHENGRTDQKIADELYRVWKGTFTDSNVVQILHQTTALSAVFDDAYYRTREKPAALNTNDTLDNLLILPDPTLPSQILLAVKQSVEYWQRTVLWLGMPDGSAGADSQVTPKDRLSVEDWIRLRDALIEQCGIWFNLMTGQQDLRGFTVESITHQILDEALADLRRLAQRDLPAAAQQAAQQVGDVIETAAGFVADISRDAARVAKEGIERLFNTVHPLLWIIIVLSGLTFVILLVYMLSSGKFETLAGVFTSLVTGVLGLLGVKQGSDTKTKSQDEVETKIDAEKESKTQSIKQQKDLLQNTVSGVGSGLAGTVGGALGQSGAFLVEAYDKGLRRIQIELQSLNFSVAVAHPLIEFFVRHYEVDGDLDFLTRIIWDKASREAQLRRVVTAAFGPISILLSSSSSEGGDAATDAAPPPST